MAADQAAVNAYWQQQKRMHDQQARVYWQRVYHQQHPNLNLPNAAEANFAQQRQGINEGFRVSAATNAYNRAGATQNYVRKFRDMAQMANQARENMPYDANSRGLLTSGIFKQQLMDYAQQRARNFGDLNAARAHDLGGFDLVRQNIENQRAQALAAIEAQRQAMMGQLAPGTVRL